MSLPRCQNCGDEYYPKKPWQKYCGQECNQAAYFARKFAKKRDDPTAILEPKGEFSEAQLAEWARRGEIREEAKEKTLDDMQHEAQNNPDLERITLVAEEHAKPSAIDEWLKKND